MAASLSPAVHPYLDQIGRVFYNYRIAELNRRYYSVLLDRAQRRNLIAQLAIGVFTVIAAALFSLMPSFPALATRFGQIAAILSALAFVASVVAPVFGWNQKIDQLTSRIHAWHYAERQLESALRFLHHSAQSKREAELQVQFADEAFGIANNLADLGKQDMKLTQKIREEVEKAIPPDYVWTAL
jgi:hypothetical protein